MNRSRNRKLVSLNSEVKTTTVVRMHAHLPDHIIVNGTKALLGRDKCIAGCDTPHKVEDSVQPPLLWMEVIVQRGRKQKE